ncbi:MAG: serine hydrolase domain-containing protein [Planctomycetota bacterium]
MHKLIATLLLATVVHAEEARFAALDKTLDGLVARKMTAGGIVVVAEKGQRTHLKLFGEAAPGKPMKEDTIFRIYSMSKPVTAVAALILVDEGKLELDAPIAKYLPALKDLKVQGKTANEGKPARAPTVRDLFTHTAGFTYGWGASPVDLKYRRLKVLGSPDLAAMVGRLQQIPLVMEPGARWHYGVSTDVLGAVVEAVAKQPLDTFMRERIFVPLKMVDTGFHVPKEKIDRLGANYGRRLEVVDAPATSRYGKPATFFSGGGGLVSTAGDYLRFALMLRNGGEFEGKRILKAETVQAMRTNQLEEKLIPIRFGPMPMPGTGFGLGVSVFVAKDPPLQHGEYGWAGAASTVFTILPEPDAILITMVQQMPINMAPHMMAKGELLKVLAK